MEYRKRNFAKLRIGQQLGNYRLLTLLGQGSFADVYLGEHIHLKMQAAIKVLDMRLTNDDMSDFLNEARTVAHLQHPAIVRVLEFGVEDNTPFLVMDYAPNGTLRTRYPTGSRLEPEELLPYLQQIASALQHAHNAKLIHRDIKPENMLLGVNNEALLSDFGIAVVAHSSRTQSMKGVVGTVAYMAPEQLRGKPVVASDQYALGAVVYEWLTGNCPFHGSFVEVATQHTHTSPRPLREQIASIPPAIEQIVLKTLAKDPAQRFDSVQEFAQAFEQALHSGQSYTVTSSTLPSFGTAPLQLQDEVNILPSRETTIITYQGHSETVNAVAWAPDVRADDRAYEPYLSTIASASDDNTVQIWYALTGRKLATYKGHTGGVAAIAWSPNGKHIASASTDGTIQIWHATSTHRSSIYHGHTDTVTAVAWDASAPSTEARIASASADGTVQIWHASTGRRISTYRGHTQTVLAVAWSPDGQYLASTGEDRTVQVWKAPTKDAPTKNAVVITRNSTHEQFAVAWSPDGNYIASAGADQIVEVWEPLTGNIICTYRGHQFTISALAWSPDSKRIASASFDRTVHVWDSLTGENAVSYPGHTSWVYSVSWSPTGQYLASASADKTVQVRLAL
jgi:serine/threonine protein kinase